MTGKLILVRHQESEWNKLGKWTGKTDIPLSKKGLIESERLGELLKDVNIDYAYSSNQLRTIQTLECIINVCKFKDLKIEKIKELRERDYGDYTGKNKWDFKKEIGDKKFNEIRRGWSCPIPNGETLADVYNRVLPFYQNQIIPKLNDGKTILIVAHGNSLRSLVKYIEDIHDENICEFEFPFNEIFFYDIDKNGKKINLFKKQILHLTHFTKTDIVATIGPNSSEYNLLLKMVEAGVDIVRLNMSWGSLAEHEKYILNVRKVGEELLKYVPIMMDLPGPRIPTEIGHSYNKDTLKVITEKDIEFIKFGIKNKVDYFAVSFVGNAEDIREVKKIVFNNGGSQKVIAKIERKIALENLEEIINESDAVMVARGDLGEELPLEQIPFIEEMIINKCKQKKKYVIVATQMMMSMFENDKPSRADVTDVVFALEKGANATMLSDETVNGKYPLETVIMMDKILYESEKRFK